MISYFVNLEVMKTIDHVYKVECKHGLLCTCFLFYTLNTCIHRTSRHISACLSVCLFVYRSVHSLFLCMFERLVNAFTQNYFAIWLIVVKSIITLKQILLSFGDTNTLVSNANFTELNIESLLFLTRCHLLMMMKADTGQLQFLM